MLDKLALLAPGDPRPPDGPALVLTDGRAYSAELFAPIAREVVAGPRVDLWSGAAGPEYRVRHPESVARVERLEGHVLFFAATDTDVKTLAPIAHRCRRATFLVHAHQDDSAARALETERLAFDVNVPGRGVPNADAALLTSDWSAQRRDFIRRCRSAGVPTLCLQEAVNVDFDGPPHRMRWADAACISGPGTLRYLQRELSFLTGNPRFDGYTVAPPPPAPLVLINCNFILGAGGERGPEWMKLVLDAVHQAGVEYRITKHPRDDTDLSGIGHVLASGAYRIADQLAACSVLISRDSSLPYEAILSGRPVIYFDPFHEKERTLREDESGFIRKCVTTEQLLAAIREMAAPAPLRARATFAYDPYAFTFTQPGAGSVDRVLVALRAVCADPECCRTTDARAERGAAAALQTWTELWIRPQLRRVAPLRRAWRAIRKLKP